MILHFTRGPWHAGQASDTWYLDQSVAIYDANGEEIADGNSRAGSLSRPQAERRANARFIATAPQMFDVIVAHQDAKRYHDAWHSSLLTQVEVIAEIERRYPFLREQGDAQARIKCLTAHAVRLTDAAYTQMEADAVFTREGGAI